MSSTHIEHPAERWSRSVGTRTKVRSRNLGVEPANDRADTTHMSKHNPSIQAGDVVRGRRAGTKTDQNFVVDTVPQHAHEVDEAGSVSFYGHREHTGHRNVETFITVYNPRVIRSYR